MSEPDVTNTHAHRLPPPSSVDPAGFARLHRAVSDALIAHAGKAGVKPPRFSERYDIAVRVWRNLNPSKEGEQS
ncbi:hypothetical protein [Nocardia farcinica]|uniref:hypothetical protein n=1 Tax=Nocardia farcinica TaxID=37329 RepID=UPI0024543193|nr:hypothetical protein [Nocardia farcinica]